MIYILLGAVAIGVITACTLEYRRVKREKKEMRETFKIDTSEWEL